LASKKNPKNILKYTIRKKIVILKIKYDRLQGIKNMRQKAQIKK